MTLTIMTPSSTSSRRVPSTRGPQWTSCSPDRHATPERGRPPSLESLGTDYFEGTRDVPDTTEEAHDDDILCLRRRADDRAVVVHAVGELDHLTASQLADELANAAHEAQERPLVLDLTGISFIASAGIAVLVEHHQRGRQTNHDLRIVIGHSVVARTLQRTGLIRFLPVHTTMADALPDE